MPLIDDEGRIFGVVNVVDALVILVLIAVFVAGIAIVDPFASLPEKETKYATVDLGSQPNYIAENIETGDKMIPQKGGNVTVTDKYVTPFGENTSVVVRTRINGTMKKPQGKNIKNFAHGKNFVKEGDRLTINTSSYSVVGEIQNLSTKDSSLETGRSTFSIKATTSPEVAKDIDAGDTFDTDGSEVANIKDKEIYPVSPSDMAAVLRINAETIKLHRKKTFQRKELKVGTGIDFSTDRYDIQGKITRNGPVSEVNTTQKTVTLKLSRISPDIAKSIQTGMTEKINRKVYARITDKKMEPAKITLTSESGQIYERTDPINKDLSLKTELTAVKTPQGLEFQGTPLKIGNKVFLDLGDVEINGTVSEIQ